MPSYDFQCLTCETVFEVSNIVPSTVEKHKCGKDENGPLYKANCPTCREKTVQRQFYAQGPRNFIHTTHSSMYGKYHHGLGMYIHDKAHKERELKKRGLIEAHDPVGGSRTMMGDSDFMGIEGGWDPNSEADRKRVKGIEGAYRDRPPDPNFSWG